MKIKGITDAGIAKIDGIESARIDKFYGIKIKSGPPLRGFTTEWTVLGNETERTITLPLYNSGTFNCIVDWGDDSDPSTITAYDDVARVHTYANNGIYEVKIQGACPAWSFNGAGDIAKITDIIDWGDSSVFSGFSYLSNGFKGCSNIKSLGVGKIKDNGSLTSLQYAFNACTAIDSSIPIGFFDNCTHLTANGFYGTFSGCNKLSGAIPADLFKYNTGLTTMAFNSSFSGCSALTSIPVDLFRYNTLVSTDCFMDTFKDCIGFTGSIPTDLFRYNIAASGAAFYGVFDGCLNLLGVIPIDLFRYNTLNTSFQSAFSNCGKLTSISSNLFRYNTACVSFYRTFYGCTKLQQNALIFYATGGQSTRFLNKTVTFYQCFYRTAFTGTKGTAPDLWNCVFGTGTPTKTNCWGGAGNSISSLSNYKSINTTWI